MAEQTLLTDASRDVINGALNNLNQAVITSTGLLNGNGVGALQACTILDLALGPLDLNILGLRVYLHDCEGGPVTVTITAIAGEGLLGDLLGGLLGGFPNIGDLIGSTLQDLINQLLEQLYENLQPV